LRRPPRSATRVAVGSMSCTLHFVLECFGLVFPSLHMPLWQDPCVLDATCGRRAMRVRQQRRAGAQGVALTSYCRLDAHQRGRCFGRGGQWCAWPLPTLLESMSAAHHWGIGGGRPWPVGWRVCASPCPPVAPTFLAGSPESCARARPACPAGMSTSLSFCQVADALVGLWLASIDGVRPHACLHMRLVCYGSSMPPAFCPAPALSVCCQSVHESSTARMRPCHPLK